MNSCQYQKLNKQQGATLFTAIMFLIMLCLLGVNAAQMSGLEERMAGNTRNRDLAYQSAEAALKYVENNMETIGDQIPAPSDTTSGTRVGAGLFEINTCLPNSVNYWTGVGDTDCTGTTKKFNWSNDSLTMSSSLSLSLAAQPQYVLERLPNVGQSGSWQKFRVTARGVGGDSNTVVILQTLVCFTPIVNPSTCS